MKSLIGAEASGNLSKIHAFVSLSRSLKSVFLKKANLQDHQGVFIHIFKGCLHHFLENCRPAAVLRHEFIRGCLFFEGPFRAGGHYAHLVAADYPECGFCIDFSGEHSTPCSFLPDGWFWPLIYQNSIQKIFAGEMIEARK